jgi:CRP/FNR family transcriptional regulator
MANPYGLELSDSCLTCQYRREGFFCELSAAELRDFDRVKVISAYPAGSLLFVEEQRPRGIYILCEGQVKLYFSSSQGKVLTLRIVRPGDVLGLFSALSGKPYEVTAETLQPCQVAFASSSAFQKFLCKRPAVFKAVANRLGLQYRTACETLCRVGLGTSIFERLARFLLDWSADRGAVSDNCWFTLSLTHDEIAEYLGTTRESVTRMLSEFRSRGLIESYGSSLVIPDRAALQEARIHEVRSRAVGPQLVHFRQHRSREVRHSALAVGESRQRTSTMYRTRIESTEVRR